LVSFTQTFESFGDNKFTHFTERSQNRMGRRSQVQAPGSAIGWVGPAFNESGFLQSIDHAAYGYGLHVQCLGETRLVAAFVS